MSENQKPFIPAWLDDAGMSPATFRVYAHLLRSADNKTGIAWPSYDRMAKICGISKRTVRRSIDELDTDRHLIVKIGKPFGSSCRYRVITIVPPEHSLGHSNSVTTDTIDDCPIVPPEHRNSATRAPSIVPPEHREGNPKKVIQRRVSNKETSPEGIQFALWFKSSLPETVNLGSNWQQSFAKTYDQLVRIDKRTPEQIREVSRWARTDYFWQSNFMSPAKLRNRNTDGIQYFDVFVEKMKQASRAGAQPPASQEALEAANKSLGRRGLRGLEERLERRAK